MRSRPFAAAAACAALLAFAPPAAAGVYASRKEALESAFPGAERVDTRNYVLDDAQARAVEELARAKLESRIVTLYSGVKDGQIVGYALIDVHTVRTLPEAFLIVITPAGEVRGLRMLAFYEPEEYLPSVRWLEQFEAQTLGPELALQRRIHGIAGSTLSSRAVTSGVRRALALWSVLVAGGGSPPTAAAGSSGR